MTTDSSRTCILVTGGAGFIGSHLIERLLARGDRVIALDDLSTGSLRNLSPVIDHENFRFVQDDVRNDTTLNVLIEQADAVFHLAAAVGVQLIVDRPVHTIETNIHGTEVVLNLANKYRTPVLLASTSEVYGKSERVPFKEDDDTVLGATRFSRWSYACSKAIDEFLGLAYHDQYGLPVVITRLFNTVGPRQTGQYGMVIPRFVSAALRGEPLTIFGTGKQSRCFGFVGDVVDALMSLMDSPAAFGNVYNVGSTQEVTIEALARRIIELTASRSETKYVTYEQAYGRPFDDMMRRVPDLTRISDTIDWAPTTSLDDILRSVIDDARIRLTS
ncbi:MAG: GDP-mannose 4,6-dehydratase [Phycisphaerales bacterium]|nr:GDP-mannose 4,6-dehydratase [Phycisphaerales bacterium]MCB9854184.1 GDP-mannose 4,6-dehydratase [Phycisphaerales bacterium]